MNHYETCRQALEQMRGDDLFRAKSAFANMTAREMEQLHGASGKSRAEILADYQRHDAKVNAALEWLKTKI